MSVIKSDKFKKNSLQIYNLLKVLYKNKPLENLKDINEVYDNQADMIEEIIYYNNFRGNKSSKKDETVVDQSDLQFEENEEVEDEDFDATVYVNKMKNKMMWFI